MAYRSIAAAVLVLAAACGGDGGGGGGSVSTGLPPDQKLSELDDASAQRACQALSDSVVSIFTPDTIVREQCVAAALESSATPVNGEVTVDVQKCRQMSDACIADPPAEFSGATVEDSDDCSTVKADETTKGCGVTVREYEACVNAVVVKLQAVLASFTCDNWKTVLSSDQDIDFGSLPECKSFKDQCPDVPLDVSVE
jgi:hypothetical protein